VSAKLLKDFIILFATIDPIGTLTLFVALTHGFPAAQRRRIAARAVGVAAAILIGFLALGQLLLGAMHISLHSFQIAGSLFLLIFGAQLTFGTMRELEAAPEEGRDVAVFPLAMPSIASPGAMTAAVVLTDNAAYTIGAQAMTMVALLVVLALTYALLLVADPVHRALGRTGAAITIRVMGLLLAALAVEMLLGALASAGLIPHIAAGA
jgi:multiple antibiotic resistance protein